MTLWFKIEYIFDSMPSVIARQLQQQDFMMSDGAMLGGCRIKPALSQPRKLKADGQPDYDVFAFHLIDGNDRSKFAVGDKVELVP